MRVVSAIAASPPKEIGGPKPFLEQMVVRHHCRLFILAHGKVCPIEVTVGQTHEGYRKPRCGITLWQGGIAKGKSLSPDPSCRRAEAANLTKTEGSRALVASLIG